MIIDAKVSLKDYEDYFSSEAGDKREKALTAHIGSLRSHIRSLAAKRYEALDSVLSLDVTLMFVPIEAAFLAAVEKDRDLFSEAFEKNIIVVSPSTLLVTLRTIQNIWRHEYQNRNTLEIAKKAGALYDKFVGFVEALEDVGEHDDGKPGSDHCQGAVHKVGAAVWFHNRVGQLLKLERQLKGGGIVIAPANHDARLHVAIALRNLGDPIFLDHGLRHKLWHLGQHFLAPGITVQADTQQGDGRQLSGIGLGGSNGTLLAGV